MGHLRDDHDDLEALEDAIGWKFCRRDVLVEALTHSTYANENPDAGPDNERLEFLGDSVLDLIVSHLLYERPEAAREGEMSRRRARVVRREGLARLAEGISLGRHLRLGEGQKRCGETPSILADAYEALAGAVFIDGGFEAAARCFAGPLAEAVDAAEQVLDFKTRLQELCHSRSLAGPEYVVLSVEGPPHDPVYRVEVRIGPDVMGSGRGRSKKDAEQVCARVAIDALNSGAVL